MQPLKKSICLCHCGKGYHSIRDGHKQDVVLQGSVCSSEVLKDFPLFRVNSENASHIA